MLMAGAVLKADIVSECGAYSTDAYFIMEQLYWLECTISSSYLEECRLSDLHHSSDLTSHGVGLANHILVDSYHEFKSVICVQESVLQFRGNSISSPWSYLL